MKPVVSIVGRPNVGKSSLFNRLTNSRDALTADVPGITRDVLAGDGCMGDIPHLMLDTAGISSANCDAPTAAAIKRSMQAIRDAERLLWVVDAKTGLNADDIDIAEKLRQHRNSVTVAINKSEGRDTTLLASECHNLGYKKVCAVSAMHGKGLEELMLTTLDGLTATAVVEANAANTPVQVAIVGRQNAGKSTLVNCLLGKDRVLVGPTPGITRDSVKVDLRRAGYWQLIDTAGIRRNSKVKEKIEGISMAKSLKSIDEADISMLLLDAVAGVTKQDLQLLAMIMQKGKRYIVVMNKSDLLPAADRRRTRADFAYALRHVPNIKVYAISALQRTHIKPVLQALGRIAKSCSETIATGRLNNLLQKAIEQHPPPLHNGRRPRLLYAHIDGMQPLRIVVHGRQVGSIRDSWRRYLVRFYCEALKLEGTPMQIVLRAQDNPYVK
ncbi:MAG: ribosome biogenesis GTPase Der [Candidatus Porifericomitaceae bacterium WSBS_2022_MAG_OTU9]